MGRSRRHQVTTQRLPLDIAMTTASLSLLLGGLLGGVDPVLASQRRPLEPANIDSSDSSGSIQMIAQVVSTTLAPGSTGADVRRLQAMLKLLNFYQGDIDGIYSPVTQAAVASFQTVAGIEADGIVGPATWQKLLPVPDEVVALSASETPIAAAPDPAVESANSESPSDPPLLSLGTEGSAVSQLQRELQALGYYDGPIDGGFGQLTEAAVIAFQTRLQLVVDGIVGPSTWEALTKQLGQQ